MEDTSPQVDIDEIVNFLEMPEGTLRLYINKKSGQTIFVSDEELEAAEEDEPIEAYPDWQHASIIAAQQIINAPDDFIEVIIDKNTYTIMEDFCYSVENPEMQHELLQAIQGKGAFGRFRTLIYAFKIELDWYSFRTQALVDLATAFCKDHHLNYSPEYD